MRSRSNGQLNLPPAEVRRSDTHSQGVRTSDDRDEAVGNADISAHSALLFNEAVKASGLESKEVAHLCGVSISLVDKWRKPGEERSPSLVQLMLLPPQFWIAFFRVMNKRHGYGRAALTRLQDAAGDLALLLEA